MYGHLGKIKRHSRFEGSALFYLRMVMVAWS